jgi:hypothetical protein
MCCARRIASVEWVCGRPSGKRGTEAGAAAEEEEEEADAVESVAAARGAWAPNGRLERVSRVGSCSWSSSIGSAMCASGCGCCREDRLGSCRDCCDGSGDTADIARSSSTSSSSAVSWCVSDTRASDGADMPGDEVVRGRGGSDELEEDGN